MDDVRTAYGALFFLRACSAAGRTGVLLLELPRYPGAVHSGDT